MSNPLTISHIRKDIKKPISPAVRKLADRIKKDQEPKKKQSA
jgi:hypothetical protein